MQKTTSFLMALTTLASTLTSQPVSAETKKEQCYGLVKAGKNDCAAADSSHSCATYAKRHGNGQDWIALPAGVCERIIGGSLTPTSAEGTYATKTSESNN